MNSIEKYYHEEAVKFRETYDQQKPIREGDGLVEFNHKDGVIIYDVANDEVCLFSNKFGYTLELDDKRGIPLKEPKGIRHVNYYKISEERITYLKLLSS